MTFDDGQHTQEPIDREEYEAWEKTQKEELMSESENEWIYNPETRIIMQITSKPNSEDGEWYHPTLARPVTHDIGFQMAAAEDALSALKVAINSVECASLGRDGEELPWYKMAKQAIAKSEQTAPEC